MTADADGQHLPKDIFETASALCVSETKKVLILGTRNFDEEQVPFKSRSGNKITSRVFKIFYGKWINDTQTGLRAIPNGFIVNCLELKGERFEYEINMLIEAVNKKIEFKEVEIETVYFDDNRETHFHPVRDSIKIYRVMLESFIRFTIVSLLSMLLDQGIFLLFQRIVLFAIEKSISIPLSTITARVFSSLFNYSMNRKYVFEVKKNGSYIWRYYTLCIIQMIASAVLVTVLYEITTWNTSILKIIVDTFLFCVSFCIQRVWVFKRGR